jgi:hypothetical protein
MKKPRATGNVFVEIEKDNVRKFNRLSEHSKIHAAVLLNEALKRWLRDHYKIALQVSV